MKKTLKEQETLTEKVYKALKHPYVLPEVELLHKNEQNLAQKYMNGEIKKKDFELGLERIQKEIPSLIAKSLPELELILGILDVDDAIKRDTLVDMTMKYEQAISKGHLCRFSIWIYKSFRGGLSMYCATQIKV